MQEAEGLFSKKTREGVWAILGRLIRDEWRGLDGGGEEGRGLPELGVETVAPPLAAAGSSPLLPIWALQATV
jgi:hypothetical protein